MIALKNCKAVTISDGILDNATILIEDGILKAVEVKAEIPKDAKVIDLKGMWVTPGFIDVHTHGALTYDFCDADPQAVFKLAEAKLAEGVYRSYAWSRPEPGCNGFP